MEKPYTSTILTCSVHSAENATHVSLVKRPCDNPLNLLRVRDVSKPVKYGRRFTVCLSPMHTFDAHFRFIEWIELNRIIGAEKILIYNYSSGVNVENVIKHYVSKGLVEIVQWKLPFSLGNIEYFAQKAALNDCIFRNKNISEFIVNIDKDEFIIPHSKDVMNWSQMIEQFDKNYAAYLFRNSFYRTDWFNTLLNFSGADIARNFSLVTLTHVEREKKIFAPTYRSKYIARSAFVEFGNIHEVPRGRILNVPPEVGLLHHYRKEEHDKAEKKFKDLTVLVKFGHRLIQNVKQAWQEISKSS